MKINTVQQFVAQLKETLFEKDEAQEYSMLDPNKLSIEVSGLCVIFVLSDKKAGADFLCLCSKSSIKDYRIYDLDGDNAHRVLENREDPCFYIPENLVDVNDDLEPTKIYFNFACIVELINSGFDLDCFEASKRVDRKDIIALNKFLTMLEDVKAMNDFLKIPEIPEEDSNSRNQSTESGRQRFFDKKSSLRDNNQPKNQRQEEKNCCRYI